MKRKSQRQWNSNPAYTRLLSNWRELTDKQTPTELIFEHELAKQGLRYRFQHLIWRYIVDFTLPDLKVGIELDGDSHKGQEAEDAARDAWLTKQGWRMYRFTNKDAAADPAGCIKLIKEIF